MIRATLTSARICAVVPEGDPVLIEAHMRLEHSTPDGLLPDEFRREARRAHAAVELDPEAARQLAERFGLVVPRSPEGRPMIPRPPLTLIHASGTEAPPLTLVRTDDKETCMMAPTPPTDTQPADQEEYLAKIRRSARLEWVLDCGTPPTRPLLDAVVILLHLRPDQPEIAAWCHGVVCEWMRTMLRTAGLIDERFARLPGHICSYLEMCGWRRERDPKRGRWTWQARRLPSGIGSTTGDSQ